MPGPFYNLTARLKLRALKGNSEAKDIDAGFLALAEDVDTALGLSSLLRAAHAANFAGKSGELAVVTATATDTLPAAAENAIHAVFTTAGTTTVTVSGGAKIYGDFVNAAASITLLANQHVILQSDGANWFIIAGEPKREAVYVVTEPSKAECEAGIEPSATRPSRVILSSAAELAGVFAGPTSIPLSTTHVVTLDLLPGQKWKATVKCAASTLVL
jgi:hypothetical protein